MDLYTTVLLGGLALVLLWIFTVKNKSNLPPGPFSIPIVGNLPFMNKRAPYKSVLEFSKTYGPVMTIYLGWQRAVFLVGYDAVKEAIVDQGDDFSGRAPAPFFIKATKGYDLAVSQGERWKQLRRFTLTTLRDFGMGRKTMETWIQEESRHLVARIETFEGFNTINKRMERFTGTIVSGFSSCLTHNSNLINVVEIRGHSLMNGIKEQ